MFWNYQVLTLEICSEKPNFMLTVGAEALTPSQQQPVFVEHLHASTKQGRVAFLTNNKHEKLGRLGLRLMYNRKRKCVWFCLF